tara:strand:- start:439 stop:1197 length:759 start_codon:yes stop_codon:yes gene_type:complete
MIEVLILSIVQGITEFLPVSSSSHLIIISKFSNFKEQSLSIDISMHIGSFFAVITYFKKEIFNFIENRELFYKILLSSIPVFLIGLLLIQTNFIEELRNIKVIGWMTLIFGILLYISDKFSLEKKINSDFSIKSVVIIGSFQVLSLIPGVSRSGVTITAARFLKFKRYDSAKISFLLSIPTLGAITVFGIKNIITSDSISFSVLNMASIIFSFLFSLITIKYFLKYIEKFSLKLFVIYRIILGLILLSFSYL